MSDAPVFNAVPPSTPAQTDEKLMPVIVYTLYLLGFLSGGLTAVVGVIVAYTMKGGAGPFAYGHYRYQIRSFWLGLLGLMIGGLLFAAGIPLLLLFLAGVPVLLLAKLVLLVTTVWWGVRSLVGLIRAAQDEPCPRPASWLL